VRYYRSFTFKLLLEQMEHPESSRQHYRTVFRLKGMAQSYFAMNVRFAAA
jgi:hypothetical protein